MTVRILVGDVRETLRELPDGSVRCCVTSPPYFGLRDYGHAGQIGLEPTPDAYVAELVAVFREVRRVLTDDGTLWLNLGDSYAATVLNNNNTPNANRDGSSDASSRAISTGLNGRRVSPGLPAKNLLGIPWRVAFALQADGWYLRSDIIWAKPNPMPESVTDRPTKSHEYLFLLSKSERYFYDAAAIAEPVKEESAGRYEYAFGGPAKAAVGRFGATRLEGMREPTPTRNARTVWTITTQPFKEAHFATFPPELPERCIKAGSATGDTILDPFGGAGTTGLVADRLGRNAILCELNPDYAAMAERRIHGDNPLFADVAREDRT